VYVNQDRVRLLLHILHLLLLLFFVGLVTDYIAGSAAYGSAN
jgi:hypothetical protein